MKEIFAPNYPAMGRTGDSGLEVKPSTDPQVAAQPGENKYYIGSERLNHPISYNSSHPASEQPNQFNDQSEVKGQSLVKAIGILIVIVVLLLAVALGAGLGVGLSAQHKTSQVSNSCSKRLFAHGFLYLFLALHLGTRSLQVQRPITLQLLL